MFKYLLLVVTLFYLSACSTITKKEVINSPMDNKETCIASNGLWKPMHELYPIQKLSDTDASRFICDIRTGDGGAVCTGNHDCKGRCLPSATAKPGQAVEGVCSGFIQAVQGTLTVINGKVSYPIISTEMFPVKLALLNEFKKNRQKWLSHNISNYIIALEDTECYCLYGPYYGPNRVTVRNGEIISVIYRGERRDGFKQGDQLVRQSALKYTIEDIFKNLERTITNSTENVELGIEYDKTYGFPTMISFDRPDWSDVQSRLLISNFQPK